MGENKNNLKYFLFGHPAIRVHMIGCRHLSVIFNISISNYYFHPENDSNSSSSIIAAHQSLHNPP